MYNRYMSIRSSVIDEISLEGLDGITLEGITILIKCLVWMLFNLIKK